MIEALVQYEAPLRLALFVVAFAALAAWEVFAPRRALLIPRARRWLANIAILILNASLVRIFAPAAAVGIAFFAEQRGIGLLHLAHLPKGLEILFAAIALDLAIYLQHVLFHAVPLFWRLHRVHHADLDFDVTTGTRFHPLEILLSLAFKAAAIFIIGAPAAAVLIFEIVLNLASMFSHSNIRIPKEVDAALRCVIVTPDMHRVHHSIHGDEADRNFGFSLAWWDRIFGTYRAQPRSAHEAMKIGIPDYREQQHCATLTGMLFLPFMRERGRPESRNRRPARIASPTPRA